MTTAEASPDTGLVLRDAQELGQLVKATSEGSRYVCVLLSGKLNAAARIQPTQVSIRVEPVANKLLSAQQVGDLVGLGFKVADNSTYASLHFNGLTQRQQLQSLASILAGLAESVTVLGTEICTFQDLLKLPGKGA